MFNLTAKRFMSITVCNLQYGSGRRGRCNR